MKIDYPCRKRCHKACIYRKKKDGHLICTRGDSYPDIKIKDIEKYYYCPVDADYYNHQDVYFSEILTNKGLLRLSIISGEPLWVAPAFEKYLSWLRRKRSSVLVLSLPVNVVNLPLYDYHLLSDSIYAEFLLSPSELEAIERIKGTHYEALLPTLPDELREILTIKERRRKWGEPPEEDEKRMMEKYDAWESSHWIGHIVGSFWKSGKISRDDYLSIRNHFDNWE